MSAAQTSSKCGFVCVKGGGGSGAPGHRSLSTEFSACRASF